MRAVLWCTVQYCGAQCGIFAGVTVLLSLCPAAAAGSHQRNQSESGTGVMNGSCQGSHILSGTCKKESLVTCVSWVCRLRSLGLAAQALALPPARRTLLNGEMEKGNWKWLRKTLEKTFHWISNESRVAVYPGSDDWHPRNRKRSKKSYFATFLETFLALPPRSMAWRRKECAPVLKVRHGLTGEMWGAGWRRGSLSSSWVSPNTLIVKSWDWLTDNHLQLTTHL